MGRFNRRVLAGALIASCGAVLAPAHRACAQAVTTAFTYQGELQQNGELVDGVYDFRFGLCTSNQPADPAVATVCADNVEVVGGRFTVELNFSHLLFAASEVRYLELAVRPGDTGTCADSAGFETLVGRTLITPTPYALAALNAGSATSANALGGTPAASFARRDAANTWTSSNTFSSQISASGLASTAAQGTAPLTVLSTTKVANLNVDQLDGIDSLLFARRDQPNSFGPGNSFNGLNITGSLFAQTISTDSIVTQALVAIAPQGAAPLVVASSTKVNNLNADMLDGLDSPFFARRDQPNTFTAGNTFPDLQITDDLTVQGNMFTTALVALNQVAALAPQGTAPLVVSSTTKVNNLNAEFLNGSPATAFATLGGVNNFAGDNTFITINVLDELTSDTVAANTFALPSPVIRTLTIPAFAFQTDGQIPFFRGAHELRGTSTGTVLSAYAAVQLPNGATIQSISYNALDNAASDLTLVLRQSGFSSTPVDTPIVVLNTSGTFATFATNTHTFTAPLPVVDNTTKSYYLSLSIPVPAFPADLRMGDVHITYTVTELQP